MLEKNFEKNIEMIAGYMGCRYFKIPDTHMINSGNRRSHKEEKRPFDAILITPNKSYIIEAKIGGRKPEPHQLVNILLTNSINPDTGYYVRYYEKYIRVDYQDKNGITKYKFNDIKDMILWFIKK